MFNLWFLYILIFSLCTFAAEKSSFSRYRYKAESGAYIEATRKETFSVCPAQGIQGTWISEYSVSLNKENCLSVQAPNLAGTFRILFLQNSRADTIQVLVEQSYIQMGDYTHKIWVRNDNIPEVCNVSQCKESDYGHYEDKKYEQALIVDKTEFTMRDAQYYSQFGINLNPWLDPNYKWGTVDRFAYAYPPREDLKTSMRPYLDNNEAWNIANMRSKLEGLDTVYSYVQKNEYGSFDEFTSDTSSSGYRLPFKDEWAMLMRAGASTKYYWGNEEDSLTISNYTLVNPIGYTQHKVAQKLPNAFGLYDMISPNNTNTHNTEGCPIELCSPSSFVNQIPECRFLVDKVSRHIKSSEPSHFIVNLQTGERTAEYSYTEDFYATSIRLLRKTPKLQKLEKF